MRQVMVLAIYEIASCASLSFAFGCHGDAAVRASSESPPVIATAIVFQRDPVREASYSRVTGMC